MNMEDAKNLANQSYFDWYKREAPEDWWETLGSEAKENYCLMAFMRKHPELSPTTVYELFKENYRDLENPSDSDTPQ